MNLLGKIRDRPVILLPHLSLAQMGEGGSIPFMGMLGEKFPRAQFLITGVLGPHSNAHGPNEFLHLATGKGVTTSVALVLADHAATAMLAADAAA